MKAENYTTAALTAAIIGFCWLAKKRKEKIGKLPYGKIRTKRYTKDALLNARNVTVNDELYKKDGEWYISEELQQRTGVEQIKYKKDLDLLLRAIKESDNGFIVDHDEIIIEEAPTADAPIEVEQAPAVVDVTPTAEVSTEAPEYYEKGQQPINVYFNDVFVQQIKSKDYFPFTEKLKAFFKEQIKANIDVTFANNSNDMFVYLTFDSDKYYKGKEQWKNRIDEVVKNFLNWNVDSVIKKYKTNYKIELISPYTTDIKYKNYKSQMLFGCK